MIRTAEMMLRDRHELRQSLANNEVPLALLPQAWRQLEVLNRSILAALSSRHVFIQGNEIMDDDSDSSDDYVHLRSLPEPSPLRLPSRSMWSYGPDHERYDHYEVDVYHTQCGHRCIAE